MILLDTHALVWLYEGRREMFPPLAGHLIEAEPLAVSPMALLELRYLFEIGGIKVQADDIFDHLHRRAGLVEDNSLFSKVVRRAYGLAWTRDPFDRLIVAQAECADVRLLTKDLTIQRHFSKAIWD